MKVRVEIGPSNAHVEALDNRGDLLGELTAADVDPGSLYAQAMELDQLADAYANEGDEVGSRYAERASRMLGQCLAVYEDMQTKAGRELKLWTIESSAVNRGAPRNTLAAMFRAIVTALGKRNAVVWAGKCTEYLGIAEEQHSAGEAWKSPAFRQGLWMRGPVAFAPLALDAPIRRPTGESRPLSPKVNLGYTGPSQTGLNWYRRRQEKNDCVSRGLNRRVKNGRGNHNCCQQQRLPRGSRSLGSSPTEGPQ